MNKLLFLSLGVFALIGAGCWKGTTWPVVCTEEAKVCPDGSTVVRGGDMCVFAPCPVVPPVPQATSTKPVAPASKDDLIRVTTPLSNAQVTSPLTITGEARGNWYFEASFPIEIRDANNTLLGTVPAQAQGSWMTTNYVPFTATLVFSTPSTATGTLILKKDNPSGEPQNDNQLVIPITF